MEWKLCVLSECVCICFFFICIAASILGCRINIRSVCPLRAVINAAYDAVIVVLVKVVFAHKKSETKVRDIRWQILAEKKCTSQKPCPSPSFWTIKSETKFQIEFMYRNIYIYFRTCLLLTRLYFEWLVIPK